MDANMQSELVRLSRLVKSIQREICTPGNSFEMLQTLYEKEAEAKKELAAYTKQPEPFRM